MGAMSDTKRNVGRVLRFIASEGWADQDPSIVEELLDAARELASVILADKGSSDEARSMARDFLDRLEADSY